MQILTTTDALRHWREQARQGTTDAAQETSPDATHTAGGTPQPVALVPTMGNLHAGHIALCHRARQELQTQGGGRVIVSIFVNPLQFGPQEDLDKYPRTFEADCAQLAAAGVDAVFHPDVAQMYPNGPQQYMVEPPALQNLYCGAFRPGHFRGVATVVAKLFHLVQPDVAVFGKKDYQQLAIIRGMVADLNMPVRIVGVDTQRAPDGLALSSRNGYLSPAERAEAPRLRRTLLALQEQIQHSTDRSPAHLHTLEQQASDSLNAHGWQTDYIRILDGTTLLAPTADCQQLVILAASTLGRARLIDNLEVQM